MRVSAGRRRLPVDINKQHSSSQPHTSISAEVPHESRETAEGVRGLLAALEPLIVASGSLANLQGMLSFMEDADEAFDQHDLVNFVRRNLQGAVGDLVKAEVAKVVAANGGGTLTVQAMKQAAPVVLANVLASEDFCRARTDICRLVEEAAVEVAAGMGPGGREFERIASIAAANASSTSALSGAVAAHRDMLSSINGSRTINRPMLARADSEQSTTDSLCSTWNHPGFLFMRPGSDQRLAEAIHPYAPLETRLDAMRTLLGIQLADVVGSAKWNNGIRDGLKAALADANASVATLALQVHQRLLANISPAATVDAFASLTGAIVNLYRDQMRSLPSAAAGLNYRRQSHQTLARLCKATVDAAVDMPRYWSRWPDHAVENVVAHMVTLLTVRQESRGSAGRRLMHPRAVVATVAPTARWAQCWLHSGIGRKHFVKRLKLHGNGLIPSLMTSVATAAETRTPEGWAAMRASFRTSAGRAKGSVPETLAELAHFCFSARFLLHLASHAAAEDLLELNSDDRQSFFVDSLISFVATSQAPSVRGPATLVADGLAKALAHRGSPARRGLASETLAVDKLLLPLRQWTKTEGTNPHDYQYINVCKVLNALTLGRGNLLLHEQVDVVLSFCSKAMSHHSELATGGREAVVALARHVSDIGAARPAFVDLINSCAMALDEITEVGAEGSITPTNSLMDLTTSEVSVNGVDEAAAAAELRSVLLACLKTPRGLAALANNETNALKAALDGKWMQATSTYSSLPLLAHLQEGRAILLEEGRVLEQRAAACQDLLDCDNHLWSASKREVEANVTRAVTFVGQALFNGQCLRQALISSPSVRAHLLLEFMDECVSLRLLTCAMSNLDNIAHMEANFTVSSKLAHLDRGHRDSLSMLAAFVADKVSVIGPRSLSLSCVTSKSQRAESIIGLTKTLFDIETSMKKLGGLADDPSWLPKVKGLVRERLCGEPEVGSRDGSTKRLSDILLPMLAAHGAKVVPADQTMRESGKANADQTVAAQMLSEYGQRTGILSEGGKGGHVTALESVASTETGAFDWFAGLIYLLEGGNEITTKQLLAAFSVWPGSELLWPSLGRQRCVQRGLPESNVLVFRVSHWLEVILNEEAPLISARLKEENISAAALAQLWLNQIFLGILTLEEIAHFIIVNVCVIGIGASVFICLALLRHRQAELEAAIIADDGLSPLELLAATGAADFKVSDYLPYMESLSRKWSPKIKQDLLLD